MPLDLNKFLPADESILFGDKTFIITARLPTDTIINMDELKDIDPTKQKENVAKVKNILKEMLYLKNKKEDVDSFVDGLDFVSMFKVFMFIQEYIKMTIEDSSKKKDLNPSSTV